MCGENLNPPAAGISLVKGVEDMIKVTIQVTDIYDKDYIEFKDIGRLAEKAMKEKQDLTLGEADTLINNLGAPLFLSFIEHQVSYHHQAQAWDWGMAHLLDTRTNLQGTLDIIAGLVDTQAEG